MEFSPDKKVFTSEMKLLPPLAPVLNKVPSGLKHSNTMMNTVPLEPPSPMKTKKTSPRISQGNIVTPRNVKKLKVGTDMTSSIRLGDDLSSLSSPGMPQLKFGASLDKKFTADTGAFDLSK